MEVRALTTHVYELPETDQADLCGRALDLVLPFAEAAGHEKDVNPISVVLMTIGALTHQLVLAGVDENFVVEAVVGAITAAHESGERTLAN